MSLCPPEETRGPCPEAPSPEAVEFIRFCRGRRRVGWPELYDEMILVACRGLFHGYGFEELAERGVGFSLRELPRLAALVVRVVAEERPPVQAGKARRGRAIVGGSAVGPEGATVTEGREREGAEAPPPAPVVVAALATG